MPNQKRRTRRRTRRTTKSFKRRSRSQTGRSKVPKDWGKTADNVAKEFLTGQYEVYVWNKLKKMYNKTSRIPLKEIEDQIGNKLRNNFPNQKTPLKKLNQILHILEKKGYLKSYKSEDKRSPKKKRSSSPKKKRSSSPKKKRSYKPYPKPPLMQMPEFSPISGFNSSTSPSPYRALSLSKSYDDLLGDLRIPDPPQFQDFFSFDKTPNKNLF
jgi:hypothetical protein